MRWTSGTENCVEGHHGTYPICPLGTEGWDGQVGQRIVLRDTMGRPLMSHMSFGIEGWDGHRVMLKDRHYGTAPWDVSLIP